MSNNNETPASESEWTDIGKGPLSPAGSDFTIVENPRPANSDYDVVSNADRWSVVTDGRPNASTEIDTEISTVRSPAPGPVSESGPSHALTIENMTWKEINEVAGGSVKRYKEMVQEKMKRKTGVAFTPEAAIPAPGEAIGDKQPGYEEMSLGAKFWSWWTQKELRIFETQVLKEIEEKIKP